MSEVLKQLKVFLENVYDPDFDYDVEHWENANYDDSFSYGWDCGENSAFGEVLKKLKELTDGN